MEQESWRRARVCILSIALGSITVVIIIGMIFLEFCCNFRVHGAECGLFGVLCVLWVVFAVATWYYTRASSRGSISIINPVSKFVAAVTNFWIDDKEKKAKPKESSRSHSESSSGDSESSSGDSDWLPLLKDATSMVSDVVGAATSN
ncbi:hypothetical protein C8Q70DRAFT_933527 [Cubamyces menziesii]|nr:hypothetical protein C8Q70DRAFT_933527 [Cubamyces menziesii]